MSSDRNRLEQYRDQALLDLVDLADQVDQGEVPEPVAAELRARYESAAATAITALESIPGDGAAPVPPRRGFRGRVVAYAAAAAVAVVAAVLLPGYVGQRPTGAAVTGNEVFQGAPAPTGADLSQVSDAEMESVVAANPEIIAMRVALADRYLEAGKIDEAAGHYRRALDQNSQDPEAQAHYGWLLLYLDRPQEAADYVDRALAQAPDLADALWFKANIALYGLADPATAIDVLGRLAGRPDIGPTVQSQVDELIRTARQQQEEGASE